MDIRPFHPDDEDRCLAIFDSNLPGAFQPDDRKKFIQFLGARSGPYFVMQADDNVLGCGGYSLSEDGNEARLRWAMIDRAWQRKGLGRFLLLYRLRDIGRAGAQIVTLATPVISGPFYQKQGFRCAAAETNAGWVEMYRKLEVCP